MVSFFGLKLGSDRKKKGEKPEARKDPKTIDRNGLGEGQYFGTTFNKALLDPSNIPRPDTSASNRSLQRPRLPYARGGGGASSSMVDLSAGPGATFHATKPSSGGISLKPMGGSEANMYMRWQNSSSTSLVPPPKRAGGSTTPSGPDGRPGTAGSTRSKAWVNPLDVHFCRDSSTPSRPATAAPVASQIPKSPLVTAAPQIPQSPLGNFEFNMPPFDTARKPELEHTQDLKPTAPLQQVRSLSPPSPKSYPSPPHSLKELEPPLTRIDTGLRPPSRHRDASAGQDPRNQSTFSHGVAPASLPSPAASAPRSSEEGKEKMWTGPVIQNVRAKRDTLTVRAPRRHSFSMDVDQSEPDQLIKPDLNQSPEPSRRPGTAGNGSPPPRSARRPRPQQAEPTEVPAATKDHDRHSQWKQRGPSPFDERENRFQAPRPHDDDARQLREGSPYRRGPMRQPEGQNGDARPHESARPAPQMTAVGHPKGRERQWPDRAQSIGAPHMRGPPAARHEEFPPPNRPMPAIPVAAPRPPPEGQYRGGPSRPPREGDAEHQQSRPRQEAPAAEEAPLGPSPPPHAAAPAGDHPSKGPQDFNSRPGFGQSSAKRRPPPPRLHTAPPPLRLRRDVDSPVVADPAASSSRAAPDWSGAGGPPSNPVTSAKFNTPRQAPSPPSTATTFHHPSSPVPQPQQLHPPPPPVLEGAQAALDGGPRTAPVYVSRTPDVTSNPNWPLVDSGPPSAAFTLQSPDGVPSPLGLGIGGGGVGSKPASPAGMPLASPAFGTTFNLGGNSPVGPSHWTPQRPTHDRAAVRPDHGLRAPTGIADEFSVKFI